MRTEKSYGGGDRRFFGINLISVSEVLVGMSRWLCLGI